MADVDAGLSRGRRGRHSPTQGMQVIDMWEAGFTDVDEIASQTGYTRGQVAIFLRQAGHEAYPGHATLIDRYSDAELEEMLDDYYIKHMKVWELVQKWDLAENASFYNIIRRLGKKPRSRTEDYKLGKEAAMDEAVRLYDEEPKLAIYAISEETGVDPSRLNREVRKRGIVLRSQREDYDKAE